MNNTIEVGKVARLSYTDSSGKTYFQDVLVTAIAPDGAVTGHRIVKKTGQPEKGTGTWTDYSR